VLKETQVYLCREKILKVECIEMYTANARVIDREKNYYYMKIDVSAETSENMLTVQNQLNN
jgi:hypothetical protein